MSWRVIQADCIEAMADMDEASVDAIVTDPPYGLEFMGKEWDRLGTVSLRTTEGNGAADRLPPVVQRGDTRQPGDTNYQQVDNAYGRSKVRYGYDTPVAVMQQWHQAWAEAALRVLKPGGHLLAFGGTRTYHRLTCALEDAGFEIRDCLAWMYGSGFPKSLNLDGEWQGWGTALKPAFEPIVLARKPLAGTVAANVLEHGTGALNIDGTRIEMDEPYSYPNGPQGNTFTVNGGPDGSRVEPVESHPAGRWPANVILDEEAAVLLDEQSGESQSRIGKPRTGVNGNGWGLTSTGAEYDDLGGASRFFYCPKADREERNRGLEHRQPVKVQHRGGEVVSEAGWDIPGSHSTARANHHPTVKPVQLMQWLCRLITPPNGTILDPFLGSGTTAIAALREGFSVIGIEREPDYIEIARDRIIGDAPLLNVGEEVG